MCKKLFCILLSLALVLGLALPALAEEAGTVHIHALGQLKTLAENCRLDSYSKGLTVILEEDLDLSREDWEPIPIFCGTFQGKGHTITGLNLTSDGSYQGLFRYLGKDAQVLDLNLKGTVAPGGTASCVGSLAGQNRGLIKNCTFSGTVSGIRTVGGLVGENAFTGTIEDCRVQGSIQGSHFAGGIAGQNTGVIRSCVSHGDVNTTSQENTVSLTDIDLDSLMGTESASTVTDIGGIAGQNTGVIRDCVNHGDVGYQHMGYNIGGIAGTQSGYIQKCVNRGNIRGRKEVGGIVGQLEPAALVSFEKDALQILREQLGGMGSLVNKTAANVQDTGDALFGQVVRLGDYVTDASDAVELLLPEWDGEDLSMPDEDHVNKARTLLSSSIGGMTNVLSGMSATTMSAVGKLSNNLHAMQSQMNAMVTTIDNASETLGGSIQDMSDQDTDSDVTGKLLDCKNVGTVLADINAGGIAGAVAMENDLDPEADFTALGSSSLNFESQLRAVVRRCQNEGAVTAGKRAAGGITGWQSLGLVKDSVNTGPVEGEAAEYVGGISGQSLGFIRNCSAKCTLTGGIHLGGIAGSASVVTDCYAMPLLLGGTEQQGAILGGTEEDRSGTEQPTGNNYYLRLTRDDGGIDGVSYAGIAQPLGLEAFFRSPQVPASFREAKITFLFDDGTTEVFTVAAGEKLEQSRIPALPEVSDCQNAWEGLQEADLNRIFFDQTFRETRHKLRTVLESSTRTEGGQPLLLAQGVFPDSASLDAKTSASAPALREKEVLLGAWVVEMSHPEKTQTLHIRIPQDSDRLTLRIHTEAGWQEWEGSVDGSYLVLPMEQTLDAIAMTQMPPYPWHYPALIAAAAAAAAGIWWLLARKKRK